MSGAENADLAGRREQLDRVKSRLHKVTSTLSNLEAEAEAQKAELAALRNELRDNRRWAGRIQGELSYTRGHPYRVSRALLLYWIAKVGSAIPWPRGLQARFERHVELRRPDRPVTLPTRQEKVPVRLPVADAERRILSEASKRFLGIGLVPSSVDGDTKISVLMPVYNTPSEMLRECLESVLSQTWNNWELCIVNDASPLPEAQKIVNSYAAREPRIQAIELKTNRGIAGATQAALELSTGSHIALLDHDDVLAHDALEKVAEVIAAKPDVGLIYSDECKIDTDGLLRQAFAKPDWSPAMLLSSMYTGHLSVYRRDLVVGVGGFRSEYNFSQDYDLALRVTERDVQVHHIPEILYGWRMHPVSAAAGGKEFARVTNLKALQAAIDRRGWNATARWELYSNRIEWHDDGERPLVSLIIPSDNRKMIEEAARSIRENTSYTNYEIVVVTNSKIVSELEERGQTEHLRFVRYDRPFNFSDKCNAGAEVADGEYVIFYNDDVRVQSKDWIERILDGFRIPGIGAVAPKLLYETNTIQHAGMVTGVRRLAGTAFHQLPSQSADYFSFAQSQREVTLLCGALLAMKAKVFHDIGGYDAVNTPIYHSDIDLCFKLREEGLRCLYTPHATLLHIGHVSIGAEEQKKKVVKKDKAATWVLKRWPEQMAYDPYFPGMMRDLCYHDSPVPFWLFPGSRALDPVKGDILLVVHDLSRSGVPRVVVEMAHALKAEGWFVVVASRSDGELRAELEQLGLSVIIEPQLFEQSNDVRDLAKDYDLVIANTVLSWPLVAQLDGIVPTVWYIHETDLIDHLAGCSAGFRTTMRQAKTVWAVSDFCAGYLVRLRDGTDVVEVGIEGLRFSSPTRPEERPLRLGVFGSIERRKAQDALLEALSRMDEKERAGLQLGIFGRVLDKNIAAKAQRLFHELPEATLHGEIGYADCIREIAACDLVVVPSRSESMSLVALEAMSAGVPVLTTSLTGISAYLEDGVSGFISLTAVPADLLATLRFALSKRGEWSEVGVAGAKVFEDLFTRDQFRARLAAQIEAVLQER